MTGRSASDRALLRERIPQLHRSGLSVRAIARELQCDRDTIRRILSEFDMMPREPLDQRALNTQLRDVSLDGELAEVVDGLLLGDGGIDIRSGRVPRLSLTNKSWEYARYVQGQLERFGVATSMGTHVRGYARLWTTVWPSLGAPAAAWYGDGSKKRHVPADVRLTPISVLHWYLGDGGLAKLKGKRPAGYIYTNSFPLDDVERLAAGLTDLGIAARAMRCGAPQDHEWRIYLKHSAVIALLEFIGPPPVDEYAYKWEADVVHARHHEDGRMAKLKARDSPPPCHRQGQ